MKQCEKPESIKSFGGSGIYWKQEIVREGVGVGKSRHIEAYVVSDTVLVNATVSL